MTEAPESSLIAIREGAAGTILMNRPKALNALNQEMIRGFAAAIADWRHDASVKLALLEGAGGRAFCAGGDVRAVRRLGFTPASTLNDALEIASDVVGRTPTITHMRVPPLMIADVK